MTLRIFIFCLLINSVLGAQKFQTVVEVEEQCGQLSFMSNQEAEIAVDLILDQFGLTRTFVIQECPDIENAVAKIVQISPNYKERYIFYDSDFLDQADGSSNSKWGSYFILAHEIGHHLNGHSLDSKGSTPAYEIEADYFAGTAMGLLGATLDESQRAIETLITYEKATATHPAKVDRLAAIEKGWNEAKKRDRRNSKQDITRKVVNVSAGNNIEIFEKNKDKKSNFFKIASAAFEQKRYKESAINYLKAYQFDSNDLSMLYFSGVSFILAGELDLALKYLLIVVKNDYGNLSSGAIRDVNIKVGLIYEMKNQNEDAIKFLELLIDEDSEDRTSYVALASAHLKQGNIEEAARYANMATTKSTVQVDTSYNLGIVFFSLGNYDMAQKYSREAIEVGKKDPENHATVHNAYINLSSAYLNQGNSIINELNALGTTASDNAKYDSLKKEMDILFKKSVSVLEEGIKTLPNAQGLRNRLRTLNASIPK